MDIIGTWHLVSAVELDSTGKVVREPFGPTPYGQIMYAADGGMSAVLANSDRVVTPSDSRRGWTDEEAQTLARGFAGYAGDWVEGDGFLEHHVRVSFLPDWVGGVQIRQAKLEGDVLILSVVAHPEASDSPRAEITWHRAKPRS